MKEKKYKHPLAVRAVEDGKSYAEFDAHDRQVYHMNAFGYFSFSFFRNDEPHNCTPYFVLHKYHRLYNPEHAFA